MSTLEQVELAAGVLGPLAVRDRPLGPLTTFRIGGAALLFVTVENLVDVERVIAAVESSGIDVLVVGRGSNMLVADSGFPGLAVTLGRDFESIVVAAGKVLVGAAASLPVVARRTAACGLAGFEWAVGVPGSMGGAVRMNAGGHGSQLDEVLVDAEVADLTGSLRPAVARRTRAALGLGYRTSNLSSADMVLSATLALAPGDKEESEARIAEIVAWRREHQPGGQNCGSIFVNPEGDSAGRLIEEVGLKGYRIGTARVSEKHANFFQADPNGYAADMRALIDEVAATVGAKEGVYLHTEVRMVGF